LEAILYIVILALVLVIPTGSVLGFLAFLRLNRDRARITQLEQQLNELRQSPDRDVDVTPQSQSSGPETANTPEDKPPSETDNQSPRPLGRLKDNWMIWLGGLSVALAGIFMVSHSVAVGLIGPTQQFLLALATGTALHLGAEFLRRRHRGTDQVFAALAGGGSITLYAALLAGVHHFQLISPITALAGMAIVSIATLWLALIHGPLLAIMGLSGAYVVPILLGGDGGSVRFLLSYSFLITLSSLLLMRYVFRAWLWYSTLAGALMWWLITTTSGPSDAVTAWYLALLLPAFGGLPGKNRLTARQRREAFFPLLALWGLSIAIQPDQTPFFWSWLLILPATILLPQTRAELWYLPWLAVLGSAAGWLAYRVEVLADTVTLLPFVAGYEAGLSSYLITAAVITVGLGLWQWRLHGESRRWISLCLLAPLVWLTLAWLLLHGYEASGSWAVCTFLIGGLYGAAAWQIERRALGRIAVVFAILAAHISYSLAVVMWFREASLTLALSIQFVTLTWLAQRYDMPELYRPLKLALALVVARLTLNPWIADYDTATHWSLWTYGGATLCAAIASRLAGKESSMRPWLEAASLHLLVLFLGTELRYWLYDGDIFARRFSMTEATLNTLLWGALSVTYMIRSRASESLAWLYQWFARALLLLAGFSYLSLISYHNPWWADHTVGGRPIFNLLLLAYAAPALLATIISRFAQLAPRRWSLGVAAGGFLLFTALQIRHLWQGVELSLSYGVSEGELYTYSIVGLLYAIVAIVYGTSARKNLLYKTGMALLGLVIAKIFLIDMAGLQGFWRVAAFMGLGLALLGLAWIYRNAGRPDQTQEQH